MEKNAAYFAGIEHGMILYKESGFMGDIATKAGRKIRAGVFGAALAGGGFAAGGGANSVMKHAPEVIRAVKGMPRAASPLAKKTVGTTRLAKKTVGTTGGASLAKKTVGTTEQGSRRLGQFLSNSTR